MKNIQARSYDSTVKMEKVKKRVPAMRMIWHNGDHRTSQEIVNPTMGSVLRGRFDGASLGELSLVVPEIHFSRLFIRGRCRDDESEAREIHFPAAENYGREVRNDCRIINASRTKVEWMAFNILA